MQPDPSKPDETPPTAGPSDHRSLADANDSSAVTVGVPSSKSPRTASQRGLNRTRVAGAWIGLIVGALILILLLVFIVQNNTSTEFSILFWDFSLPLGVAMLFAAVAGALIMALAGGARILQLRKAYKAGKR